jgi:hypothetical protein
MGGSYFIFSAMDFGRFSGMGIGLWARAWERRDFWVRAWERLGRELHQAASIWEREWIAIQKLQMVYYGKTPNATQ